MRLRQIALFLGQGKNADVALSEAVTQSNNFIRKLAARIPLARVKCVTQQVSLDRDPDHDERWVHNTIMIMVDIPSDTLPFFDELYKESSWYVECMQERIPSGELCSCTVV